MSGNLVQSRSMTKNEIELLYSHVVNDILSKHFKKLICTPLGSYHKKLNNSKYGDLDIGIQIKDKSEIYNLQDLLRLYNPVLVKGFNILSIRVKIPNTLDFAQVDLMLTTNLEWLKFSYHSPDYLKGESKYKGLYRTSLIMSAISVINKSIDYINENGEVECINHYAMRLDDGLYKVTKSYKGKKGIIKTPKILKSEFITNNPEEVSMKFFGVSPDKLNSFEDVYDLIHHNIYFYRKFKDDILKKFKDNLDKNNIPYPWECWTYNSNIFKSKEELSLRDVTVLIPGGFKPITSAHLYMINEYLRNPNVKKIILFVGPSKRDVISQEDAIFIINKILKYNRSPKEIEIIKCEKSPMIEIFQWLENKERLPGLYSLGTSSKGKDKERYDNFLKSYTKYKDFKDGKYRCNLPPQVEIFDIDPIEPLTYKTGKNKGKDISASFLRNSIINNNFNEFKLNYTNDSYSDNYIKEIWNYLKDLKWEEQPAI